MGEPEAESIAHYVIGPDGSILRWWDSVKPPVIEESTGSLWAQRGEVHPGTISPGDAALFAHGQSSEGIAQLQLIVNGDDVVAEKNCEVAENECHNLELSFVTETQNWAPGVLQMEIVATGRIPTQVSSQRFWDNIPYTPPPNPGEIVPPTFEGTKHFREEYGLDLDLHGNEDAINERIFHLIGDWNDPNTPEGQVARASWERWGVPLRGVDVEELEYREWFYNTNAEKIDKWVEETEPANFAGYYLDNRAGGIMYVGFLGNQEEQVGQLDGSLNLVAQERVKEYPAAPTVSYLSARATAPSVISAIDSSSLLARLVTSVRLEKSGTLVHVGATNVAQVEGALLQEVPGAHVIVQLEQRTGELLSGRYRTSGRMRAGDAIFARTNLDGRNIKCTAGFGAKDKVGERAGKALWKLFILTAGHCANGTLTEFYRSTDTDQENETHRSDIGRVERDRYPLGFPTMGAAASEVRAPDRVPQGQWGEGGALIPTQPAEKVHLDETVCFSGITTPQVSCGPVTEITPYWAGGEEEEPPKAGFWVKFRIPADHGDSGGPVWSVLGPSVGLIESKDESGSEHSADETFVEPLLTPSGLNRFVDTGVLTDPALAPLSLKTAADGG